MSIKARVVRSIQIAESPCLKRVVTLGEATVLSGKSRTALINAVVRERLVGRRSITGGEWLIELQSLIEVYPETEVKLWLIK